MNDDGLFLRKCISRLFDESEQGVCIVSAYRLGKKHDDATANPRPLKVVLESESECRRILSRTSRLKGENFFIVQDLSPEDRVKMRTALMELKQRKQLGEENLKIVDFQVVTRLQTLQNITERSVSVPASCQ